MPDDSKIIELGGWPKIEVIPADKDNGFFDKLKTGFEKANRNPQDTLKRVVIWAGVVIIILIFIRMVSLIIVTMFS